MKLYLLVVHGSSENYNLYIIPYYCKFICMRSLVGLVSIPEYVKPVI